MRRVVLVFALSALVASNALAWNEKGHMVVARLAWLKLNPCQQAAASAILRSHPHYDEYLAAERPVEFSADEWAFLRAAYWPDWVRSNHSDEFNHPTWHYISVAYVPPYSKSSAEVLQPQQPNVVSQIPASIQMIRRGSAAEKAIHLCWLLHLVGDIHQPLHCGSLVNETFPQGDQGGNLSLVRVNGGPPMRLHATWDWLPGDLMAANAIDRMASDIRRIEQVEADMVQRDLAAHPTSADWALEGLALAKSVGYLNGDLRPANAELNPKDDDVPSISEVYLQRADQLANQRICRAGCRLATCVAQAVDTVAD